MDFRQDRYQRPGSRGATDRRRRPRGGLCHLGAEEPVDQDLVDDGDEHEMAATIIISRSMYGPEEELKIVRLEAASRLDGMRLGKARPDPSPPRGRSTRTSKGRCRGWCRDCRTFTATRETTASRGTRPVQGHVVIVQPGRKARGTEERHRDDENHVPETASFEAFCESVPSVFRPTRLPRAAGKDRQIARR